MLKTLKTIPDMPLGVSKLSYRIEDLDAEIYYEYQESAEVHFSGKIKFEFVISITIDSANNSDADLPPRSSVLYEFKPSKREGFRGFKIWFVDGQVITVSCKSVLIGNEKI
jgi:hypothetical protein